MATVLNDEDEDFLRDKIASFLDREGHDVISAPDGREAFDRGVSATPDVLVTDWMLKDHIHGLHVSEALKGVNPALTTILITGFPSQELLTESDRVGVLQLLEKPFDLNDLKDAVASAADSGVSPIALPRAIPVLEAERDGELRFATERAGELLVQASASGAFERLQDIFGEQIMERVAEAVVDWTEVESTAFPEQTFRIRSRWRAGTEGAPWTVVICPVSETGWRGDPRVRILLDHRNRSQPGIAELGPVVVLEREGVLRRLLMTQIDRIGALCYPADDLASALRLLEAEPRARTVLLDLELAGDQVGDWVSQIRAVRPDVRAIGTGAADVSEDLRRQGVECVLPKPWRIVELLDALSA